MILERTYAHSVVDAFFEYVGCAVRFEVLVETVFAIWTEGFVFVLLEGLLKVAVCLQCEYRRQIEGGGKTNRQGTLAMLSL